MVTRSKQAWIELLGEHIARFQVVETQDLYKWCYQAVLGPEHLVAAPETFLARLRDEYDHVEAEDGLLWEALRPDQRLGRLHLRPFKARGGDIDALGNACLQTAAQPWGNHDELQEVWEEITNCCRAGRWPQIDKQTLVQVSHEVIAASFPAVHHSASYRAAYRPAYRLVAHDLLIYDV